MTQPEPRFGQRGERQGPPGFGLAGALGGVVLVMAALAGLVWSAASGRPAASQRPNFFGGSVVLEDARPPTVVDMATAQITVRLEGVDAQVGAANYADVQAVPVDGGTMLVNRRTGSFNLLERDNYVADPNGPGVGLGDLPGSTGAEGLASGTDAYILRSAPDATVSLVGAQTVNAAAHMQSTRSSAPASVAPLGFARLGGPVSLQAGSAAVEGAALWVLVGSGEHCSVVRLDPAPTSSQGLVAADPIAEPARCGADALEVGSEVAGLAAPGHVRLLDGAAQPGRDLVEVPFTRLASRILPVGGGTGELWFVAQNPTGWSLFGVSRSARISGPYPLAGLGGAADPVVPVLSNGFLYTLDQAAPGQPSLWAIDTANGHMAPVRGASTYPALTSREQATFQGAEVLVDGPRVVFNNPQSLEAVVVFTDGTHPPVLIDKSQAVAVSTTGPADVNISPPATTPGTPSPPAPSVPVVQPVSKQVTCANTTQKPYAPQVTSISVSSSAALIGWSYELLDQSDCEPTSWAVHVTALSGGHQPGQPIQVVNGQNQYLFNGLRPATTYAATVTAYINAQSTQSTAVTFTTSPRGPDAPLSVTTQADGKGDWVVSWVPCIETDHPDCVVPAAQWTVIGAACSGSYVATPPAIQVPGNQSSVTINSDDLGLLGEALSFTVQGSLISGLTGSPTPDHSCTEAWRPPSPSAITLGVQGLRDGQAIKGVLTVVPSGNPVEAFGLQPSQTEFVYHLGGQTQGPTTAQSATFPGLTPGQQYPTSVDIYPAGHPEAGVTITGPPLSQTLAWPADLIGGMSVTPSVDPSDPNVGSITVGFPADLPSGPVEPENIVLQCGSTQVALSNPQPALSAGTFTEAMDLAQNGGSCTLSLDLAYGATPNPYGGPSPLLTTGFTIGLPQPAYAFTVSYTQKYDQLGVYPTTPGTLAGEGWSVSAASRNPGAVDLCAVAPQAVPVDAAHHPVFPYVIALPLTCQDPAGVDITVRHSYLGQSAPPIDAGVPSHGTPPTTTTTATTTTRPTASTGTVPGGQPPVSGSLGWMAGGLVLIWPGAPLLRRLRRKEASKP
ncbi:MAG: fibronectin type III domain-containing protein [Acidimicrobiales bacterium]|nr:fibronectin type III domain-containing protein [Acidimicrobiales bacterium]